MFKVIKEVRRSFLLMSKMRHNFYHCLRRDVFGLFENKDFKVNPKIMIIDAK